MTEFWGFWPYDQINPFVNVYLLHCFNESLRNSKSLGRSRSLGPCLWTKEVTGAMPMEEGDHWGYACGSLRAWLWKIVGRWKHACWGWIFVLGSFSPLWFPGAGRCAALLCHAVLPLRRPQNNTKNISNLFSDMIKPDCSEVFWSLHFECGQPWIVPAPNSFFFHVVLNIRNSDF